MSKRKNNDDEYIRELLEDLNGFWEDRLGAAVELEELGWKPRNDREKAILKKRL